MSLLQLYMMIQSVSRIQLYMMIQSVSRIDNAMLSTELLTFTFKCDSTDKRPRADTTSNSSSVCQGADSASGSSICLCQQHTEVNIYLLPITTLDISYIQNHVFYFSALFFEYPSQTAELIIMILCMCGPCLLGKV